MSGSIHYRRRWFYVLWAALLLASLAALALWETPRSRDEATLKVQFRSPSAVPPGTVVQAWVGPSARRPDAAWLGEGSFVEAPLGASQRVTLPVLKVKLGPRRWVKGAFVPRATWDLLLLRILRPGEAPRYVFMPLAGDLTSGLLRARHLLYYEITANADTLSRDPGVGRGAIEGLRP